MKTKMKMIISILTVFLIMLNLLTVNVQASITITTSKTGTIDGYDYELWNHGDKGNTSMTFNGGGKFSCEWSSDILEVFFYMGKRFDNTKTHQEIGNISIDYNCDYKPTLNSTLGVSGITLNPCVEYNIIDSWAKWTPPGYPLKDTITVDGCTYNVYSSVNRTSNPAIIGELEISQYWSVRTSKRTSGKISVSEHFKEWERLGMKMGKMWNVDLCIEGYQSGGSADVTSMTLNIDPPEPKNTLVKCVEDINGDGVINMADIMLLASSFNTASGSTGYNERYDLDKNGAINMTDIMMVASKFNSLVL